jgi:L-alanine-DL-glutamate epimerase-like enolase superfamily enzyme
MKIARITPIAVSLPLTHPLTLGGTEITAAKNMFVRMETDDGLVGWGEASSAPAMTGETIASMMAAVRHLAPFLVGRDPAAFAANLAEMDRRMYGNASAKTALEIAAYDIAGKAMQKPVAELIGATRRTRMPVLWMLANGEPGLDAADGRAKRDDGFSAFKIKVGGQAVAHDVDRAVKIRRAVDGAQLSADANQGWDVDAAIAFVDGVGDALDFIEQPVMGHDLDGMARIARRAQAPLGADEGLHSMADIRRHHEVGAAQGGSLKMIKLGGVTRAYEAAQLCQALGMKINIAGKIAESSVATAAVLQLAAAAPSLDWGLSITNQYVMADVVRNPIPVRHGHAELPAGAGLGIEVDEQALARLAFDA